jgi:hypothetical protein
VYPYPPAFRVFSLSSVRWSAGGEEYMRAENRGGDQRAISLYMHKLIFFFFILLLLLLLKI